MPRARPGESYYVVHPESRAYWVAHQTTNPGPPGRNQMVEALRTKGVSRTRARNDWQHLLHTYQGGRMTTSETMEPLKTPHTDLTTRLAKAEARIAGQARELDALRQQLETLRQQHDADHTLVAKLEELRALLGRDDSAWFPLDQMLRQDVNGGKGPLRQFLTTVVGRPPLKPY